MCGISAVIDRHATPESVQRLLRMHGPIRHRGPDGEGFLVVDRDGHTHRDTTPRDCVAALAFRRLTVIDVSQEASQPMASPDGTLWIVFNGEIYNFRALRERLAANGRMFRTHGDTEVALAAYEAWGTRCFEELDGMWAIVVVDLRRRVVVASRDRFGIKPLHWAVEHDRLFFSSEIKQIVAARDERPSANAPLVASYLRGRRSPVLDETFIRGITPFPEASVVEVSLDDGPLQPQPKRFFDFAAIASREIPEREYPRQLAEFEEAFRAAIDSHMVADVNIGFLLSGGLDSSALAAVMAEQARAHGEQPAPTFSFGFRDAAPRFCEMQYADAVARRQSLRNFETTFDAQWVVENAGRVMCAIEEPVLAMPALAQYRVFELCRTHGMTVVLDGEGSDEILGGYPYHQRDLLIDRGKQGRALAFARELHAIARRQERWSASVVNDFFVQPLVRKTKVAFPWLDASYGPRAPEDVAAMRAANGETGGHTSRVNQRLFRDVKWGNVKMVLGYTDRVSMAHSIEARVPYFDLKLITMAFSLPDTFKVGRGERKRILRDVARKYLPPEVTERKDRMGFGTPDGIMIRGAMWPDVEARITDPRVTKSGAFAPAELTRFIDDFRAQKHDDFRALWRVYALARWCEEFGVAL